MQKKNIIIIIVSALLVVVSIFNYFYRPDWQVDKVVREGEMNGKTIQTVVAERSYRDFKFSPVMNGMTTHIADLPPNTIIISLHTSLNEVFEGKDGEAPALQALIQNDDGTACSMDINNVVRDIQQITSGKVCALGEKSTLMVRDASAMRGFKNGSMKVLLSFVSL